MMRLHPSSASKKPVQVGLWFATCLHLCTICYPQVVKSGPTTPSIPVIQQTLDTSILKVKSGEYSPGDIDAIVQAHAVQAMPVLEEQFKQKQDFTDKLKLATALVKMKDSEGNQIVLSSR